MLGFRVEAAHTPGLMKRARDSQDEHGNHQSTRQINNGSTKHRQFQIHDTALGAWKCSAVGWCIARPVTTHTPRHHASTPPFPAAMIPSLSLPHPYPPGRRWPDAHRLERLDQRTVLLRVGGRRGGQPLLVGLEPLQRRGRGRGGGAWASTSGEPSEPEISADRGEVRGGGRGRECGQALLVSLEPLQGKKEGGAVCLVCTAVSYCRLPPSAHPGSGSSTLPLTARPCPRGTPASPQLGRSPLSPPSPQRPCPRSIPASPHRAPCGWRQSSWRWRPTGP